MLLFTYHILPAVGFFYGLYLHCNNAGCANLLFARQYCLASPFKAHCRALKKYLLNKPVNTKRKGIKMLWVVKRVDKRVDKKQ